MGRLPRDAAPEGPLPDDKRKKNVSYEGVSRHRGVLSSSRDLEILGGVEPQAAPHLLEVRPLKGCGHAVGTITDGPCPNVAEVL